jgi:septum formation protein
MPRLILSSTSTIRQTLLRNAGVSFAAMAPLCDEEALKSQYFHCAAAELSQRLATAKAQSLTPEHPGTIVIGIDQVLDLDALVFSKPKTVAEAKAQLLLLSGKTHRLSTSIAAVKHHKVVWSKTAVAHMTMRHLSAPFLDKYLEAVGTNILGCVGAYQYENLGAQLFDDISGDYYAILGLPLLPLLAFLRQEQILQA